MTQFDNYQTTFCGTAFDFFDFTYTECMGVPGSSHKTGGVTHLGSPLPPHLGGVALASSSSSLQPPRIKIKKRRRSNVVVKL